MEHGGHGGGYSSMDSHVNGNGLPYHPQSDQYSVGPVAGHHSYPPTPVTAYQPSSAFSQSASSNFGITRRKQVRAQQVCVLSRREIWPRIDPDSPKQACNNCRQRKQKCDESRPCGYCKNEGIDCEYREVPPPKYVPSSRFLTATVIN